MARGAEENQKNKRTSSRKQQIIEWYKKIKNDELKNDLLRIRKNFVEYMEYIKRIKPNPLAKKVKEADLKHNSDLTRLLEICFFYFF